MLGFEKRDVRRWVLWGAQLSPGRNDLRGVMGVVRGRSRRKGFVCTYS